MCDTKFKVTLRVSQPTIPALVRESNFEPGPWTMKILCMILCTEDTMKIKYIVMSLAKKFKNNIEIAKTFYK